jgi:hypothetical protein
MNNEWEGQNLYLKTDKLKMVTWSRLQWAVLVIWSIQAYRFLNNMNIMP